METPDCYKCIFRRNVPGDSHSTCSNFKAQVEGDPHGKRQGWFFWPFNFDPIWLISCTGFKSPDK